MTDDVVILCWICFFSYSFFTGDYEPPSFQCRSCTYGFNLDWTSTNLEEIFIKEKPSAPTTTTAAVNVTVATTSPKTSVSQKFVSKGKIPGTTAATLPTQTKPRNPNFNPKARQQFPQLPSEMPVQPFMPNMPFAMPNMPFPMPIPGFG